MWYIIEKIWAYRIQNMGFGDILIFSTSKKNLRLKVIKDKKSCVIHHWKTQVKYNAKFEVWSNFDNAYFHAKSLIKSLKNALISSVILYWNARFIQNPKFKVVESNVDNLHSPANPQIKSFKKSRVIHQWKAQIIVNPKLKILTNFGNLYFHAKF